MKKLLLIFGIIALLVVGYLVFINPFDVTPSQEQSKPQAEIDTQVACESALAYTTFSSGEEADAFVKDCIGGKYPEVIEKYKADMANPASVYCNEHDGQSVIRTASDGSQSGVCVFENGNECDEWLFFRGECTASSPVPGTEKAVQAFLANKYKKPLSEVKVTIQKEAPGFAAGSVSFGQDGQGEGGMWLAVAGNQWDVVWDGNGSVDCNKMRQEYGFPDTILKPNFCD